MTGLSNRVWKCALVWVGIGIGVLPGIASAASVSGVIEKYIEATGGREAQEAVTSAIQKGEVDIVEFGMQAEITLFHRGDDFRSVMVIPNMGEVVSGVTGGVVWSTDPMQGSRILEGGEAEAVLEQASLNPLLNWRDKYSSAEIVGEEDGMTKIELTSESGRSITNYFDGETGLLTRSDRSDLNGDTTIRFSDYKKVDDILIPHTLAVESPQANAELTIDVVLLNVDIDDKTFEMPSEILALLPETSTTVAVSAPEPAPAAEGDDFSVEQVMAFMDTNSDGKISIDEASPGEFKDNFAFIDTNGDGFADLAELKVAMAFSDGGQASTTDPAPAGEFTAEQLMTFMDTNGDGKITMDEAPEDLKQGFSFIDTNGDGGIDVKEAQIMVDFAKNQ